jgi:ATP-binding cassette subfamily A (ABC1) protein 1
MEQVEAFRNYIYDRYPQLLNNNGEMPFEFDFIRIFDSDKELVDYITAKDYDEDYVTRLALGIVFDGTDPSVNYNYRIRVNSTNFNVPEEDGRPATATTPPTGKLFENYARKDDGSCPLIDGTPYLGPAQNSCTGQYIYNGFLVMQRLVGDWIMVETGAKERGYYVSEHGVSFGPFPTREYIDKGFFSTIGGFVPLLVTLGLLYPVAAMIRYMCLEKELRQKELMKMMGVNESDIGWSWFVSFLMLHLLTATAAAAVSTQLYSNASPLILWIFWVFTMISIITFCFFLSAFFTKSIRATLIVLLVFFVGYFLTLTVDYQKDSLGTLGLVSLHPVGGFAFGLQELGRLEDFGVGLNSNTMSTTDSASGYTFANTLQNFIASSIIWGILGWYFNRIVKSEYGRALPLYFPVMPSYWFGYSGVARTGMGSDEIEYPEGVAVEQVSKTLMEQMKQGKSIEIRGLRNTFGDKTAVDGLSMSLYRGHITALLGHNGAGKTTTISMLTGMLEPTAGYATVSGKDIRADMSAIRQEIGICLQHDCLFPELTVREHVQFFARVKGMYGRMSNADAEAKVDTSIHDVALTEKRNTLSKNLSGGMKRKLSVAIAFCGDSKTVLLDEPTSGMDPFSRRFTWNVIRQYRQDRCIILTTHFMDEADILGDRIAIMAEGRLRCLGSSLFLKKTYGVGYQLTIEKPSKMQTSKKNGEIDGNQTMISTEGDKGASRNNIEVNTVSVDEKLTEIVKGAVPEATLLSNVGTEISFRLPLGASGNFPSMFQMLDCEVNNGGIVTYGVGITTLDEVFLLVARGAMTEKTDFASAHVMDGKAMVDDDQQSIHSRMNLENDGLYFTHISALFKKRAMNFKRDKKAWCCTTILPSLFVLFGFLLFEYAAPQRNFEPLTLDLNDYNVDVETRPRNPIPFNTAGNDYPCQPGTCIYSFPSVNDSMTGESYSYCASHLSIQNASCSIQESETILSQISAFGAEAVGMNVTTILESSRGLSNAAKDLAASQYGGIYYTHDSMSSITVNGSSVPYSEAVVTECLANLGDFVSEEECNNYGGIGYLVRYNFTALHVAPLYQTLADEAIVREALNDSGFTIKTTVHPLPLTYKEKKIGNAENAFNAWFLVILSFPFITGSFATFVVAERETKAKHLQTVAGVKPVSYWLSTWLWDVANYQIPLWVTVALMYAFDVSVLTTSERGVVGGVILLFVLFGPAAASFTYCVSFLFSSPSICNVFVIIFSFLIGLGGTMATFVLRLIALSSSDPKPHLADAATITEWILRFIPAFSLSKGLFNAINIQTFEFFAREKITVWHESVLFYEVIFLAWQSVVYLILAMKIDEWSTNPSMVAMWRQFVDIVTFQWLCSSYSSGGAAMIAIPDDDDVIAEQQRVLSGNANSDVIVLSQLRKVYDDGKVAVNGLSLGIPPGQCFGLLGINGAGKTTTMAMLTAEFPPTSGDASLAGYSVKHQPEKTRRRVGYCPQFDAHFANLTGREHVELYASVKGIPPSLVRQAAASKLAEVGLSEEDANRLSAGYSGGMKRRLSLACATIGQPQIVLLDECSTGVDPVARREIWQMISHMVTNEHLPPEERTSVILTTHSMEECEALCPNIGIMANGRLRCLGSAQRLKSKFGQGFQAEMKIKSVERTDSDYLENIVKIAATANVALPAGEGGDTEAGAPQEVFLRMEKVFLGLHALTGDDYLTSLVNPHDPNGSIVYQEARSPAGIDIDGLTSFATNELRMRKLKDFVSEIYPDSVLRERQDTKVRYEISSKGVRIADIFGHIERKKGELLVAEYGVSQTSLEQVFNMHAAEAEQMKYAQPDAIPRPGGSSNA